MPADTPSDYWRETSNPKVPNAKKYLQIKIFNIEISLAFGTQPTQRACIWAYLCNSWSN
jgi:hypothetical protein